MKVQVIERKQEIQVQEQEILRRKKELESSVNRPAEAEKYRYITKQIILLRFWH